jgi:alcohol dehydrogenase class IV
MDSEVKVYILVISKSLEPVVFYIRKTVFDFNLIANYEKCAEVAYLFGDEARDLSVYQAVEKLVDYLKSFAKKLERPENFNYLSEVINDEVMKG